ncbi:MAG: phospholipase D-like domain-containing protein [Candidatus Eremiobacterota bacterium]
MDPLLLLQEVLRRFPFEVTLVAVGLALWASGHAALHKRDSRAATGWVGIIWLVPFIGSALYFLFGINRIRRTARAARRARPSWPGTAEGVQPTGGVSPEGLPLAQLAKLGERLTSRPLLAGNRLRPLEGGDEAFPPMLDAIRSAKQSVTLSTYIFDNDAVGRAFADALGEAVKRGVAVRILIDDFGARYSFPSIVRGLRRRNVPTARFLAASRLATLPYLNLRKHRKTLVIDGRAGFTGGMNIRAGHQLSLKPRSPVQDTHFSVNGPVVSQLQEIFAADWAFTTGEALQGEQWFPEIPPAGDVPARAISDGPDEDIDKLPMLLLGAIGAARHSIRIATPYFLPYITLAYALYLAAARGVRVELVLPEKSNLPFVHWAAWPQLGHLLDRGCHVWLSPPPFDHTKLLVIDEEWSMIGSANWDSRSLRLNFELNVECYGRDLGRELAGLFDRKREKARPLTPEKLASRPLPLRLRDGFARLFSPYL